MPDDPVIRIENGMVVLYLRRGEENQFRVRADDSLPLTSSDDLGSAYGYPRYGIRRLEVEPLDEDEPVRFFQATLGL